jgi:hypothetical protein
MITDSELLTVSAPTTQIFYGASWVDFTTNANFMGLSPSSAIGPSQGQPVKLPDHLLPSLNLNLACSTTINRFFLSCDIFSLEFIASFERKQ